MMAELSGSTVIMAYCHKLLLNFPSETNTDPIQGCCLLQLWFRNSTWLLARTAVPTERMGVGMSAGLTFSSDICF